MVYALAHASDRWIIAAVKVDHDRQQTHISHMELRRFKLLQDSGKVMLNHCLQLPDNRMVMLRISSMLFPLTIDWL